MSVDEIKEMEIPSKENSLLFLWATVPKLLEALDVMISWGFKYKSQIIWDKKNLGMGMRVRIQHEILLIGIKGSFPTSKYSRNLRSIFSQRSKSGQHSRKPQYFRNMINDSYPDKNKIEIFARTTSVGFDTFGNEVNNHKITTLNDFFGEKKE